MRASGASQFDPWLARGYQYARRNGRPRTYRKSIWEATGGGGPAIGPHYRYEFTDAACRGIARTPLTQFGTAGRHDGCAPQLTGSVVRSWLERDRAVWMRFIGAAARAQSL